MNLLGKGVQQRVRLKQMQRMAGGLLLGMVVVYAVALSQRQVHPAMGYVLAFAEAAIVGAVADWFAVVALFRHPLGIPIWHTAIIPNNKDVIGKNLGDFVETHFITEAAIIQRIRSANPAGLLGTWLAVPETASSLGRAAAHAFSKVLASVDDTRINHQLAEITARQLGELNVSDMAAKVVDLLVAQNKHQDLLDGVLSWVLVYLSDARNQPDIVDFLIDATGAENILFKTAIAKASPSLINALKQSAHEVRDDPQHALRKKFGATIQEFIVQLKADPDWQHGIARYQQETLDSEQAKTLMNGIWDIIKARLNAQLHRDDPVVGEQLASFIRIMGEALTTDAELSARLNQSIESGSAALIHQYRGEVGKFIEAQLALWTKDEMSDRIEWAVGRDLQFIRINGTLVGGCVGLLIYALTQLAGQL